MIRAISAWGAGAVGACAILASPALALAQEAATPDKNAYDLFNPTPAADLRALCTDRPTKSTSPCTVDAGRIQVESDLLNVTVDRSGGLTTTTYLVTNPTVKLGIANTVDLELNMVPLEIVTMHDRASGAATRLSGVGDLFVRMKWSLAGDDGGNIGFAISPYVKLPTAKAGIGNGAVEAGIIAPISINLPMNWSLVIDPELDLLQDQAGSSRHLNSSGLLSLSRPVSKTLTLSVEMWADVDFDPDATRTQVSADFGAAWIPKAHPTFQLDGGINLGLNRATPGAQAYIGVSRRF